MQDLQQLKDEGVTTIYSLGAVPEDRDPRLLKYLWEKHFDGKCKTDIEGINITIPDFHAPTAEQLQAISSDVIKRMNNGEKIIINCGAGIGRTGTVLSAIHMIVAEEYDVLESIKYIRENYNEKAVEDNSQKLALKDFLLKRKLSLIDQGLVVGASLEQKK